MTEVQCTKEFQKDLKKLKKKYPSLDEDLQVFKIAILTTRPNLIPNTKRISDLGSNYQKYHIFKVKSFRCRALKGKGSRSGIRIIYYDNSSTNQITLLEIYHKSTQEQNDTDRITKFLDSLIT